MRLNKYLSQCGIASRRKCEKYILKGYLSINNVVVKDLATSVNINKDKIKFKQKEIHLPKKLSYYLLNKPKGYIVSSFDPHHKETVYKLIKNVKERIFHVGRLDYDSEGALLFTNDGELSHKLLHPKYSIPKKYYVKVNGELTNKLIYNLRSGVRLDEGITNKAIIKLEHRSKNNSAFYITISQGWKRQIKRMVNSIGLKVTYLRRDSFANLSIANIKIGHWVKLSQKQILSLKQLVSEKSSK